MKSALRLLLLIALSFAATPTAAQQSQFAAARYIPQSSMPTSLNNATGQWANSNNLNHLALHLPNGFDVDQTAVPTSLYNVKVFGAKGDNVTDDTAAIQAAVNACESSLGGTVYFPTGEYIVSGTITMHRGTFLQGAGTQGSNQNYGTSIIHTANNTNLFVWDGNGATVAAGTGGGMADFFIGKGAGFSGGDAIFLVGVDDNHRPGEMRFYDILVAGEGTALWSRAFHIDGTANNTPGTRGVRSVLLVKFRVASCDGVGFPNQCIYLSQPTHLYAFHLQADPGVSTGSFGMTLDGNWDQVYMPAIEVNGTFLVSQPPDNTYAPNLMIDGRVGTAFTQNATTAVGWANIIASGYTNLGPSFDVKRFGSAAEYHENSTWTGFIEILKPGPGNAVDSSLILQQSTVATAGSPIQRSLGIQLTSNGYNPTSGLSEEQDALIQMIPTSANPTQGNIEFFINSNGAGNVLQGRIVSNGDYVASGDLWTNGTSGGNGTVHALVFNPTTAGVGNFCTSSACTQVSIGTPLSPIVLAGTTLNASTMTSASLPAAITIPANEVVTAGVSATNTTAISFLPDVADGATSVAFDINNTATLSTTGALLLQVRNNGTAELTLDKGGVLTATSTIKTGGTNGNGTLQAADILRGSTGAMGICDGSACNAFTIGNGTITTTFNGFWKYTGVAFASLGTPSNGTVIYCSDCTIANPCASGGTGAIAKRLNATWVCN